MTDMKKDGSPKGDGRKSAIEILRGYDGPPVRIMEVCGTHTHEIFRLGSGCRPRRC